MFLSEIRIENFRIFGVEDRGITVPLTPGLTALVGENDAGKTAVMDAIRLVLGTRDHELLRITDEDFHQPASDAIRATTISIRCKFDGLSEDQAGTFAEHLSYEEADGERKPVLWVHWTAKESPESHGSRKPVQVDVRCGTAGDGPYLDARTRELLCATYLRPLRDAERAMTAGRRSRLSQILQHTAEIADHGVPFDPANPGADPRALSVLGIGDYANDLLTRHPGVDRARSRLNDQYLSPLSFSDTTLRGRISVNGARARDDARLRQLLEKLELELGDPDATAPANRGLGSNNLLFIACELLLLGADGGGVPILLVEEPEAHLHPQRQLRLVDFLKTQAAGVEGRSPIQVIVSTHSPYLASLLDLGSMVVIREQKAFSLAAGLTGLSPDDYGFLSRFLDATKANMFFARGVVIVEGDAENLLLPSLARLLDKDFSAYGVSVVNVGGIGLGRYARIYQRADPSNTFGLPVACIADLDVMPTSAAQILHGVAPGDELPSGRRWKVLSDFTEEALQARRNQINARASGQTVRTFVSNHCTLEYDLARAGLEWELCWAAHLADAADKVASGEATPEGIRAAALAWHEANQEHADPEIRSLKIYRFFKDGTSKAATAQNLASILTDEVASGRLTPEALRAKLPEYLVSAIDYVCPTTPAPAAPANALA